MILARMLFTRTIVAGRTTPQAGAKAFSRRVAPAGGSRRAARAGAVVVWLAGGALALSAGGHTRAGHSRHPYCDGGQSADGRFVVTTERVVEPSEGKKPGETWWRYTWRDTRTGRTISGRLEGLCSGASAVFDPVHAHVYVAPGGATFAVWNPNVLAPRPGHAKAPDPTLPEARGFAGFSHRLTIYRATGEVVRRLDLKDFLRDDDWNWLFCYQSQVYWQVGFAPLTRDNAPRVGYALHQVSPDHTVLETLVGATEEAARHAKARGVTPPPPRLVRVDLVTGEFLPTELAADEAPLPPEKTPGRPFRGPLGQRGKGANGQANYVPSLDPVRVEGRFLPPAP